MIGMDRSDFDRIFDDAGPQRLMQVLRSRLGDSERLDKELRRMGLSGKWLVVWNATNGEGKIVGRLGEA